MKIRINLLNYFLVLSVIFSCDNNLKGFQKPNDLIDKKKFTIILEEIMMIEYQIESEIPQLEFNHKIIIKYGNEVLKKHKVGVQQFEDSFTYYSSKQSEMQEIYTNILESMNIKLIKLQNSKKH
jgi:hypothetical protein